LLSALLLLLAGLESLSIWSAPQLTTTGLWHLTELTALTYLCVEGCNVVMNDRADTAADAGRYKEGLEFKSKVIQQALAEQVEAA
jgi:hypothetical protein